MTHVYKALLLLVLTIMVGVAGCGQQKSVKSSFSRVRDLEARNAKLEEDYRALAAERTGMANKLSAVQQQVVQFERKLQDMDTVVRERDELREKVTAVANERENLQAQLQRFAKELQGLVSRVDTAVAASRSNSVMSTVSRQTQR